MRIWWSTTICKQLSTGVEHVGDSYSLVKYISKFLGCGYCLCSDNSATV